MAQYLALTYTADVDWFAPEQAAPLAEYQEFARENRDHIRAAAVLHPTSTATVVRVPARPRWHAVRGELLARLGRYAGAVEAATASLDGELTGPERRFRERRRAAWAARARVAAASRASGRASPRPPPACPGAG